MLLGVLAFLEGCGARFMRKKDKARVMFYVTLVFDVLAVSVELFQSTHFRMANLHHLTLYALVMLDALLILFTDLTARLPEAFKAAYEVFLFPVAGFMFISHVDGNALYQGFHQVMFPGLCVAGVMHYICESRKADPIIMLGRGLWLSVLGSWFTNIGVGFFWDGTSGMLGNAKMEMDPGMAWGMLGFIISGHFMSWTVFYSVLLAVLIHFDLCAFKKPGTVRYKQLANIDSRDCAAEEDEESNVAMVYQQD
jgi:hypothetical protein